MEASDIQLGWLTAPSCPGYCSVQFSVYWYPEEFSRSSGTTRPKKSSRLLKAEKQKYPDASQVSHSLYGSANTYPVISGSFSTWSYHYYEIRMDEEHVGDGWTGQVWIFLRGKTRPLLFYIVTTVLHQ
jgi:hypothetical protein